MTTLTKTKIARMTSLDFHAFLRDAMKNSEKYPERQRNELSFIDTLLNSNELDEYEARLLVDSLLNGWSSSNIDIIKPRDSFVQTVRSLKDAAQPFENVCKTDSYREVMMWHDREMSFVPESIASKALRLLRAAQRFADMG